MLFMTLLPSQKESDPSFEKVLKTTYFTKGESITAKDVVRVAFTEITNNLINSFFENISKGDIPLRERLQKFFSDDTRSGEWNKRYGVALKIIPEMAQHLDLDPHLVFPSFIFELPNGLNLDIGPKSVGLKKDNSSTTFWINLAKLSSEITGFSAGINLDPNNEIDCAAHESFKIGTVENYMFSTHSNDANPDLSLVCYSRKRQAPWSNKKNKGVYELYAEYNLENTELDGNLKNVSYGPINVYGYKWQAKYVDYFREGIFNRRPFSYSSDIDQDEQIEGWITCPKKLLPDENENYQIRPRGRHHPLLTVTKQINISHFISQMLTFNKLLLSQ